VPELPPPLPPGERTVGQLIAETIRFYGNHFWRALPLGIPLVVIDQLIVHRSSAAQVAIYWILGPLVVLAYVRACSIVYKTPANRTAFLAAFLIYLPFPPLRAFYLLPGLAWFAFIGLAVPAAVVERLDLRAASRRGRELGAANYAYCLGSMAALVIVVGVAGQTLGTLLHTQSQASARVALALSDLVLSPLLYLGGAMLYADQAARVGSPGPRGRRRRDADLHSPLEPDAAGRPDAEGPS
jgi:hypothetical protein